jgi:hypothetical protein
MGSQEEGGVKVVRHEKKGEGTNPRELSREIREDIVEKLRHLSSTTVPLKAALQQLSYRDLLEVDRAVRLLLEELEYPKELPPLPPIREERKKVGETEVTFIPASEREKLEKGIIDGLRWVFIRGKSSTQEALQRFDPIDLETIRRGLVIVADAVDKLEKQVKK